MVNPHRLHPLWFAYILHRLSGLGLALFLPAHFYVLGLAISDPRALDGFLQWSDHPLVKSAEAGLVFLLAVHIFGGLRLLALKFMPWNPQQKTFAAAAAGLSFFVAGVFLLRAF